eukprot:15327332-Ditylum_brightwellii.AAC.1
MKAPFHPAMPIEGLNKQIEKGQGLAAEACTTYTDKQLILKLCVHTFVMSMLNKVCREWNRQTDDEKICKNLRLILPWHKKKCVNCKWQQYKLDTLRISHVNKMTTSSCKCKQQKHYLNYMLLQRKKI